MTFPSGKVGSYEFSGGVLVGDPINIVMVAVTDYSTKTYARKDTEAALSCTIKGDGPATSIKWYKKDGANDVLMDSNLYTQGYDPSKLETESIITWKSAQIANSGEYRCAGLYNAGEIKSEYIQLEVLEVGIYRAPTDVKVKKGLDATFSCTVTKSAEYIPTVSWYKSTDRTTALANTPDKIEITNDDTDAEQYHSTLKLSDVEISDKGTVFKITFC